MAEQTVELSKTDRRRLAKQKKREAATASGKKKPSKVQKKAKMTYEERRAKFLVKPKHLDQPKKVKEICLKCRRKGHLMADCKSGNELIASSGGSIGICFNCGSKEHRLKDCQQKIVNGGATYATCFICSKQGHLSSRCPESETGLYPKGGSCHKCGQVDHFSFNCPQYKAVEKDEESKTSDNEDNEFIAEESNNAYKRGDDLGDIFDFETEKKINSKKSDNNGSRKPKVIKF